MIACDFDTCVRPQQLPDRRQQAHHQIHLQRRYREPVACRSPHSHSRWSICHAPRGRQAISRLGLVAGVSCTPTDVPREVSAAVNSLQPVKTSMCDKHRSGSGLQTTGACALRCCSNTHLMMMMHLKIDTYITSSLSGTYIT